MLNFYLFEAGATKTDLIYQIDGERKEVALPGYNPNRESNVFEEALKVHVTFKEGATIFFYGSGLGSEANKNRIREIFNFSDVGLVRVHDDILGAARAAFNSMSGIICIMGTGGLAAYYNGRDIDKRRGGYGYLIDDSGGGLELGKMIITAWLNGDLSEKANEILATKSGLNKEDIVKEVYDSKNLEFIASFSKIAVEIQDDSVRSIITSYFDEFLKQNVLPLAQEYEVNNFSIIGSLGTGFHKEIREVAKAYDLQLEQCIKSPARRLFDYHLNKS